MVKRKTAKKKVAKKKTATKSKRRCFVIMPFSKTTDVHTKEYWTEFFEEFIKPTVENLNYECVRSAARPKNIIKGILEELVGADIVLAVLTDNNPNVWYELGTRHAIRSGTIMIIEEGQRIPFDINHYGVIVYNDGIAKRVQFEKDLKVFINEIEKYSEFDSPARDFFSKRSAKPCWSGNTVKDSPLNIFDDALYNLEKRLFVIGQNLFSLTQERYGFKKNLYSLLKTKPIHVDILICEDIDYIIKSTTDFTAPEFSKDLKHSIQTFEKWQRKIERENWPGSLSLKFSRKLGSLSLTFLDPDDDHGKLLLTPIVQPHALGRPCVWFSKKEHEHIFNHYLMVYESMLREISD